MRGHWQLFVIVAVVVAAWNTPVVVPLKILVVFLHELSHGLAAVLTGGRIEGMTISVDQGGQALTRGGSRFWILTAGYLGSLLIGVVLFLLALRTRVDRTMVAILGLTMLGVAVFYLRDLFAIAFAVAGGLGFLAASRYLSASVNDLILRIIGLTSMIYVPLDIISDTLARSELNSDARMLAEAFGGTTILWGILWLIVSLGVIAATLRAGLRSPSNISFSRNGR